MKVSFWEATVFCILLVLVSSVIKAAGGSMAFSNSLIVLSLLFGAYKYIQGRRLNKVADPLADQTTIIKHRPGHSISFNISSLIVLFILAGLFYWYEIRPSNIVKVCDTYSRARSESLSYELYNNSYTACLHKYGLSQ